MEPEKLKRKNTLQRDVLSFFKKAEQSSTSKQDKEQSAKPSSRASVQALSESSDAEPDSVESDYAPNTDIDDDDSAEKEFEQSINAEARAIENGNSAYDDEGDEAEERGFRPQKRAHVVEPFSAPALSTTATASPVSIKVERLAAVKREKAELQREQLLGEPQSAPDLTRAIGIGSVRTPETSSVTVVTEEVQNRPKKPHRISGDDTEFVLWLMVNFPRTAIKFGLMELKFNFPVTEPK